MKKPLGFFSVKPILFSSLLYLFVKANFSLFFVFLDFFCENFIAVTTYFKKHQKGQNLEKRICLFFFPFIAKRKKKKKEKKSEKITYLGFS